MNWKLCIEKRENLFCSDVLALNVMLYSAKFTSLLNRIDAKSVSAG
jgi:hypothetical protein